MSTEIEIAGIQIPQSDWKATPEGVKAVVIVLDKKWREGENGRTAYNKNYKYFV